MSDMDQNEVIQEGPHDEEPDENELRRRFYRKLSIIGKHIPPMKPDGQLIIGRGSATKIVPYITKNAILQAVQPLLKEYTMWMMLPDVECVDYKDARKMYKGRGEEEFMSLVKVRMKLGFIDLETGYFEQTSFEGDAFTICGKGTTVALAFAQRDFLSQVFMISQEMPELEDGDRLTMMEEELTPVFADSREANDALRIKAKQMCERASLTKVKDAAKRKGYRFTSESLDSMSEDDLLQVILTATDLLAPVSMKQELGSIGEDT